MIKKSVSLILAILMMISLFVVVPITANAENEANVTLTSKQGLFNDYTKSYKKGDTFDVKIYLQSEKLIKSTQIYLNFDHNKLRCTDLEILDGESGTVTNFDGSFQESSNKVIAVGSKIEGYDYKTKNSFINATFELLDASAPVSIEFDLFILDIVTDENNLDLYDKAVEDSVINSEYSKFYTFSIDDSDSEKQIGETGDCKWEYSPSFSTLTISGNGKMQNYTKPSEIPWYSFVKDIKKIVIADGVENIGSYAFRDTSIEQINIPNSVTEIGETAFFNCCKLHRVGFGYNVKTVGEYAFANTNISVIGIGKNTEKLNNYCLGYKEDANNYRYVPVTNFEIIGYKGTEAERYANDNGFAFDAMEEPTEPQETTEPEAPKNIVVGNEEEIFKNLWDDTEESNLMTLRSDGKYEKTYEVTKAYDGVQLKVFSGNKLYGNKYDNNIYIDLTEAGSFTVVFDPETKEVSVEGSIVKPHKIVIEKMYAVGGGNGNFLNGASWSFDESNVMTEVESNVYEITYEDVDAYDDYQVKFGANGSWNDNWGAESNEPVNVNAETKSFFNKKNIHFEVPNDETKVTLRLDLTNFNFLTLEGANFTVILNNAEIETLPKKQETEPTTIEPKETNVPEETTQAVETTTALEETTAPEATTAAPEETTEAPEVKTTAPEKTTKKSTAKSNSKKPNPIMVTVKSKTIKAKKLKKKTQTVKAITVKKAKGKVTYKLIKNGTNKKIWKYLKISKKGVITFTKWKKAKKGKYKIKVTVNAAGNKSYKKGSKTVKFKIKIK